MAAIHPCFPLCSIPSSFNNICKHLELRRPAAGPLAEECCPVPVWWRILGSLLYLSVFSWWNIWTAAGQCSSWTLLLRSRAAGTDAGCGLTLSCWNMQGLPWRSCRCCSNTCSYLSALMEPFQMFPAVISWMVPLLLSPNRISDSDPSAHRTVSSGPKLIKMDWSREETVLWSDGSEPDAAASRIKRRGTIQLVISWIHLERLHQCWFKMNKYLVCLDKNFFLRLFTCSKNFSGTGFVFQTGYFSV